MRKLHWVILSFVLADQVPADPAPVEVAFLYGGPVNAGVGWVHGHELARQALEQQGSGQVKTRFVEKVTTSGDAQRVLRQFARDKQQMIVGASFSFMNPIVAAAKENPNLAYLCASCYKNAPNIQNYLAATYQGRYVAGILAGYMSKSGIAAYIGSFPFPEVIRDVNAFQLGMRSVNPKAVLRVTWVNTWDDPQKEIEAAQLMIAQGADVVTAHNDSASAIIAAERAGVYSVAYGSDMSAFSSKQLTAIVQNWTPYFTQQMNAVRSGTFKGGTYWGDVSDGVVTLAPFNPAIPAEATTKANQALEELRQHRSDVFAGPIRDQAGKEVVAAGITLDHSALSGMNYFVEGVEGILQ